MSPRSVPDAEPIWRALADPTRRAILDVLRQGPRTTGALADAFPTTRFAVMKHLGVLVDAGLVTIERRGRERLNHLNPVPLRLAYDRWVRPFATGAADAAIRLAEVVEATGTLAPTRTTAEETPMDPSYALDVRAQHVVQADQARTWNALLDLARWWPPCWPEGARLIFEPWIGGRIGTTFGPAESGAAFEPGVEGSLWGVVAELRPGRDLVLDGTMGMPGPVVGRWQMTLEPDGTDRTRVTVTHRVIGQLDDETRTGYSSGWPNVLAALDRHATRES